MSYGSVVHQSIAERAAKRRADDTQRAERRADAVAAVREHMPDMVDDAGEVDGFAVYAYMRLKAEGKPTTPAAVRARRAKHLMFDGRTLAAWEREENQ